MRGESSGFFRSPARKKLEQMHDFKQQSEESENLHFIHEAARCPGGSMPRIAFIPASVFGR
jgi:hypothetical protein